MRRNSQLSTRSRILDAAEKTFADFGFDGSSIRHIVLAAGVNLATVYYHFGSKEGLMEEVLTRRFGPLREEHLRLLRELEIEAGAGPVKVDKVLEAVFRPVLRLAVGGDENRQAVTRLLGRIVTEPNLQTQKMLRAQHKVISAAMLKVLHKALPEVPDIELHSRVEFLWGALAFALCNPHRFGFSDSNTLQEADVERLLAYMLQFFSAGFSAPAASFTSKTF